MLVERRAFQVIAAGVILALAGCGSTVPQRAGAGGQGQGLDVLGAPVDGSTSGSPTAPGLAAPGSQVLNGAAGGPTSSATTSTSAPSGNVVGPSSLSTSGRGWTAREVYVGIITAEDLHRYVAAAGYSLDPGWVVQDINAIVKDINTHGGVLGRKLVPVFHDNQTASVLANPDAAAQVNCDYFTQDVKVIGVMSLLGNIDTANFRACLRKSNMPLIGMDFALHDEQSLREAGPLVFTQHANLSRLPAPWIARLKAQSYFEGWDTRLGKKGPLPAKIGILGDDTAVGKRFVDRLSGQLKANGLSVAKTFTYTDHTADYGSSMAAAELSFAAAGVTHIMTAPPTAAATVIFMQTAEQQGYRPRYAMSSYLTPDPLALNAPPAQLVGAVGIGWSPGLDVNDAHDQGSPAERACLAVMARGGITFTHNQRFAKLAAFTLCDAMNISVAGAIHAKRFDPAGFLGGVTGLGPRFAVSIAFGNGITPAHPTLTNASRDLHFDPSCTCFAYSGPVHPF